MGKLADWTQESSEYLSLQDGETVKVFFRGFKFIQSKFDPDKKVVRYTVDTPHGTKFWDTSSKPVARFFDDVDKDQQVKITRSGTGTDTKYDLSLVETESE